MEQKTKGDKIKKRRAIKNNIYATKLLWKICPSIVAHNGVSRFLGYFEWLFYSAFFMRYVIGSLERGDSFSKIMVFIVTVTVVLGGMSLYNSILNGRVYPIARAVVNKGLYLKLFKKSRNYFGRLAENLLLCSQSFYLKDEYY